MPVEKLIPPPDFQVGVAGKKISYVYLLANLGEDKHYLGWTTDLQRRLVEYNEGKSFYTRLKGPWKLVGYEQYNNPEEAKKRERTLKHNSRMYFLFKKRLKLNQRRPTFGGPSQVVG